MAREGAARERLATGILKEVKARSYELTDTRLRHCRWLKNRRVLFAKTDQSGELQTRVSHGGIECRKANPPQTGDFLGPSRVGTPAGTDGPDDATRCPPGKDAAENEFSGERKGQPATLTCNLGRQSTPLTRPTCRSTCSWPVKRCVLYAWMWMVTVPEDFTRRMLRSRNWSAEKGLSRSCSCTISRVRISMPLEGGMWQYIDRSRSSMASRALCFFDLAASKCSLCVANASSTSSL